jgi:hypothetical protein
MAYSVIIHLQNEDPLAAEVETLPDMTSTCIICNEVRRRDGKPVHYLTAGVQTVIFPMSRVSFIEVLTTQAERGEVLEFFRE